jgi:hypothetical protein
MEKEKKRRKKRSQSKSEHTVDGDTAEEAGGSRTHLFVAR